MALRERLEGKLVDTHGFARLRALPGYLEQRQYQWRPEIVLRHSDSQSVVAFSLIRSPLLPQLALKHARTAIAEHQDLAVVLLADLDVAGQDLERYCRERQFGLYVYTSETVSKVLPARCEQTALLRTVARADEGWIPAALADPVMRLTKSRYRNVLWGAVEQLADRDLGLPAAIRVVRQAVDEITSMQAEYVAEPFDVYRLSVLENIARLQQPGSSEHVVHSFRLYATGCVVIEHFRRFLVQSWRDRFSFPEDTLEDVWFLISMFHDCGYIRDPEKWKALAETVTMFGGDISTEPDVLSRLQSEDYQLAARCVGGFLEHVAKDHSGAPAYGSVIGKTGGGIARLLLGLYEGGSHAVVGSLDLAAGMLQRVRGAVDEGVIDPPLLASRVFPAAGAIALHDWRVRDDFAEFGLFPFPAERFPLAAILMYADAWDDYRRRPGEPNPMRIDALRFRDAECVVRVGWYDLDSLALHRAQYDGLRDSVLWPDQLRLGIELVNPGANE